MCCGMDAFVNKEMDAMAKGAKDYMIENDLKKVVIAVDENNKLLYCQMDDKRLGDSLRYQREIWL